MKMKSIVRKDVGLDGIILIIEMFDKFIPLQREDNGYQSEVALEVGFIEQQLAQRERQYEYYRNKLLTFE